MKVTYNPAAGDSDVTTLFGRVFTAGEAVDVTDEQAEKLKGNPTFKVSGEKPKAEKADADKDDERLKKVLDGRSKEAREAKAKAEEAKAKADAAERERAEAEAIARSREPRQV